MSESARRAQRGLVADPPHEPRTRDEWREAVNAAEFWLGVASARLYGLVDADVRIDLERCEDILSAGRRRGIYPRPAGAADV